MTVQHLHTMSLLPCFGVGRQKSKSSALKYSLVGHTYERSPGKGTTIPMGDHTGKLAALVLQLEGTAPGGDPQHTQEYLQQKGSCKDHGTIPIFERCKFKVCVAAARIQSVLSMPQ